MTRQSPQEYLLSALSPEEQTELVQFVQYVTGHAQDGTAPAEGSVGAVINRLSPAVRQTIGLLSEMMETPRTRPFQSKLSPEQNAASLGLDPAIANQVKGRLDREYVEAGVAERMSTPAERESAAQAAAQPPSLRELIAAAMRTQQGGQS